MLDATVRNPDETPADYPVTVYVAAVEGGTVSGEASLEVTVPGAAQALVSPPVYAPSDGMQFVLNVIKVVSTE